MGTIRVYHFAIWDKASGSSVVPPHKATRDIIDEISGILIEGSVEEVDVAHLEYGFLPKG